MDTLSEKQVRKPRRITVLKRSYYKTGRRSGGNWTTEVEVYKDLTNSKLQKLLMEKNKGLRSNMWLVDGDYLLTKKSDQKAYFTYCLSCFYDPNSYDHVSSEVGHKMVKALNGDFDCLKGAGETVWDYWFYSYKR